MPIFKTIETKGVPVKIFTNELEFQAEAQLIDLAESGIVEGFVSAMPDVHFGKGATIGSVFASNFAVCPNAVGVDIGCGMAAIPYKNLTKNELSLEVKQNIHKEIKEKIPTGFLSHQEPQKHNILDNTNRTNWLSSKININTAKQIGTLGGGNHFIEIVHDQNDMVWIMLHSGSRNIGKQTAEYYNQLAIKQMELRNIKAPNPDLNHLLIESEEGQNYLKDMSWCQDYALANRETMLFNIAKIVEKYINVLPEWDKVINIHHNYCACEDCNILESGEIIKKKLWVTRKGATSAKNGELGIIPGSMGTGSFIVKGLGNPESWSSCSHGAGRSKSRNKAVNEITQEDFEKSMNGIKCETDQELRDEAPQAYKDLNIVMQNQNDLVEPINRLLPLINIKGFDKEDRFKREKAKVIFENIPDFGITILEIEVIKSNNSKETKWILLDDYKMVVIKSDQEPIREIWVKTKEHEDKKLLLKCIIKSSSVENGTILEILEIKKKQTLKLSGIQENHPL